MAGLVPAIDAFDLAAISRRGCLATSAGMTAIGTSRWSCDRCVMQRAVGSVIVTRCDTMTELGIAWPRCLSAARSHDEIQHSINIRVLMSMVNCGRYPMPSQERGFVISRR
jgi:hypothetical protein